MERLRLASLQYFIRPVRSFDEFAAQVTGLVETAADYRCRLAVFPEYFTTQLLTLGDTRRPMPEQVRALADQRDRYLELMSSLARKHALYLLGGTIPTRGEGSTVYNEAAFFGPQGGVGFQRKLHMTRFEHEDWLVSPSAGLKVFETDFGRTAVAICYDVEFPEIARAAARLGAHLLLAPSCTDDRQGYLRVRYCAHARAIENQMYVVQASTVGSLPMVPAVSLNYGQACILTPSDFAFSRDGILAEGVPNQESMVIGELNLRSIHEARSSGTVLPLLDSERTAAMVAAPTVQALG
jgi:predicted amidohydrolase